MTECPEHPGLDTMVPCMMCGRPFCRLCNPPAGGTHYCPKCAGERLEELRRKSGTKLGRKAEKRPAATTRSEAAPAPRPAPAPEVGRGRRAKERSAGFLGKLASPFVRAGKTVSGLASGVAARIESRTPLGEVAERQRSRRAGARARRRREKLERRGRWGEALSEGMSGARKAASGSVESVGTLASRAASAALLYVPRKVAGFATYSARRIYERFPVGLTEREYGYESPSIREKWKKALLITAGGTGAWVLSVCIVRGRWTVCGLAIGLAAGVLFWRVFDRAFTVETGLYAALATAVSISAGELAVQMLYRLKLIRNIGITEQLMARTHSTFGFMMDFFWWFLVGILLPSGLLAFLVGAWPFTRVFYWRGARR